MCRKVIHSRFSRLNVYTIDFIKFAGDFMLKKRLTSILLGGLIFLLAGYTNSFSQELPTENLSFSSQVASPADTHCVAKSGDTNGDNQITLADIFPLVKCVFLVRWCEPLPPRCRADVNGTNTITLKDVVYLVNYLFKGGPGPVKSGVCCL